MKRLLLTALAAFSLHSATIATDQAEVLAAARLAEAVYQRHLQLQAARLASPDLAERLDALRHIGRLQDPGTLPLLLPFTEASTRSPAELATAVHALATVGSSAAEPAIRPLAGHPVAEVRLAAINALDRLGGDDPALWLAKAKDPEPGLRTSALVNLGTLQVADAAAVLAAGLTRERDAFTRRMCAIGLGRLGDKGQAEPLIDALTDLDPQVRRFAGEALARLDHKPAIPHLLMALEANVAGEHLVRSLRTLAGQDFGFDPRAGEVARREAVERGFAWYAENARQLGM